MLAGIADDWNVFEIASETNVIQAIEWITRASKEVSKDTIKNCFAKCGVVEQPTSINDNKDVDEEFNNLFEELSEELQIDGKMAADEYSNFNHDVCTSFPPINSDEVDLRRDSVATCIQEYDAADDIGIKVEDDDRNDEDNENESNISQISPREALNLFDMLVHVDDMNVDDTNSLITIREKMESLIIQKKRQTYIGDFFSKRLK